MESPHPIADAALRKRVRQQAVVAELGRRALGGVPLGELMQFAVEAAADAMGAPVGKVLEVRGDTAFLHASVDGLGSNIGLRETSAAPGTQPHFVLGAREPVLIQDLLREDRFEPNPLLVEGGAVSGISVAIAATQGEPWGLISLYDTQHRSFTHDDLHFVHSIANILADAIGRRAVEDRLRESEARARAVLDTTVDAIITIDDRGVIASFNRAAERIFGYPAGEVVGKNVSVLMPEPYLSEHDGYLRSYRETGRRKIIGVGREVTGRRKDGSTFPMDLAVSEVDLGGRVAFTGIIRDISERRQLELEVLRISDAERRRIGHDLHDGLGQQLTGIGLISRSLARRLRKEEHPAAETAEEITELIGEADEQARRLARGLVPVELTTDGLSEALRRLSQHAQRLFSIECTVDVSVESHHHQRDPDVAAHLYRIAQEAVSNAVRHGRASRVAITLTATAERLRLQVRDNGAGIPDAAFHATPGETRGMGLRIMHYRARIIGGSLSVRIGADGGTVVLCSLPPSSDSPPLRAGMDAPSTYDSYYHTTDAQDEDPRR
jgi:two-component system, LuxR family, sensor kinase FixL